MIKNVTPSGIGIILCVFPYLLLCLAGMVFGMSLWTNYIIILASLFLGLSAAGGFSVRNKLLSLHLRLEEIVDDTEELYEWQRQLEESINRTLPFKIGIFTGMFAILFHYIIYGNYFLANFGTVLYMLFMLFILFPLGVIITYGGWILMHEYLWVYGTNPKERPLRLGRQPPNILKLLNIKEFTRPVIRVKVGDIQSSGLEPIVKDLALFGSIVAGIVGAVAMPLLMLGVMALFLGALFVIVVVIVILLRFIYPLKKMHDIIKWEKELKIRKINTSLQQNIDTLEKIIFNTKNKPDKENLESLIAYIQALQLLETQVSNVKTFPVNINMIFKVLASMITPVLSFILKAVFLKA